MPSPSIGSRRNTPPLLRPKPDRPTPRCAGSSAAAPPDSAQRSGDCARGADARRAVTASCGGSKAKHHALDIPGTNRGGVPLSRALTLSRTATAFSTVIGFGGDGWVAMASPYKQKRSLGAEKVQRESRPLRHRRRGVEGLGDRYRDAHRSAMMQATEKAFSALTKGAYSKLQTQIDGASEMPRTEPECTLLSRV